MESIATKQRPGKLARPHAGGHRNPERRGQTDGEGHHAQDASPVMFKSYSVHLEPERFTQIPNAVLCDTELTTTQKMVWIAIAKHQWEGATASWPGLSTLAELASLSVRWVRQTLRELEEKGYLTTEPRTGRSNLYHLNYRIAPTGKADPDSDTDEPRNSVPGGEELSAGGEELSAGGEELSAAEVDLGSTRTEENERKETASSFSSCDNQTANVNSTPTPDRLEDAKEVLGALEDMTELLFPPTDKALAPILDRLAEGYAVDELTAVVATKSAEWSGSKLAMHLKPRTLFGDKFGTYLDDAQGYLHLSRKHDDACDAHGHAEAEVLRLTEEYNRAKDAGATDEELERIMERGRRAREAERRAKQWVVQAEDQLDRYFRLFEDKPSNGNGHNGRCEW